MFRFIGILVLDKVGRYFDSALNGGQSGKTAQKEADLRYFLHDATLYNKYIFIFK